jgi:hypothetical protein
MLPAHPSVHSLFQFLRDEGFADFASHKLSDVIEVQGGKVYHMSSNLSTDKTGHVCDVCFFRSVVVDFLIRPLLS